MARRMERRDAVGCWSAATGDRDAAPEATAATAVAWRSISSWVLWERPPSGGVMARMLRRTTLKAATVGFNPTAAQA